MDTSEAVKPPLLTKDQFAAAFRLTNRTVTEMIAEGLPVAAGKGRKGDPLLIDIGPAVLWMLERESEKGSGKRVFKGFKYDNFKQC
ncbi:terminase small subunit [Vibrio parahaemolyticus]|uniref:terminase small subunit n=2 Tax=Vibrio parahaemolyticus TaxID=670 RepID=UPI00111BD587|nr:terminase small subunit [Vibrio parahaemolyticus]MBD6945211.1 terminase small subunit [Vibrio parahaemolyticus]MCX8809506.1 terminase small subunit [Vibrio parahaemolyticus]MCX8824690.1 terminase small subunit [Vibrio parahaemolyticus]MCX8835200.1 terminase small subunit [Vibrio parahaemolyticus]MCX8905760.1 terminase small subunit [Vibrio parahaemolyticus]